MPLKADGFDKALIGVARRKCEDLFVYDYDLCLKVLMEREGMTHNEALEWMEYNVVSSWVGEETPIFVERNQFDT